MYMKIESGNRFRIGIFTYLLAHCGSCNMVLISMDDGNCWAFPVMVNNPRDITQDEFNKITDGFAVTKVD